ncbi:MAG: sigma-70 family RNA polymerase sigma factor [Blastocatellales bacterium]
MTEEEFRRFLNWLDADRELASQIYEKLRRRLIVYFIKRQCAAAEDLADKVLNAVMEHVLKQNVLLLGQPLPYIFGIARNVYRQYLSKQISFDGDMDWQRLSFPDFSDETSEKEQRSACLRNCLREMKGQDRQLFLLYYLKKIEALDEYRIRLAKQFGLTINALRLKMMRLRDQLRICITSCQQKAEV